MAVSIACSSTTIASFPFQFKSKTSLPLIHNNNFFSHQKSCISSRFSTTPVRFFLQNCKKFSTHFSPNASASSSVADAGYAEEPATRVDTGKKFFAIIGVKVYAAGLYVNPSMLNELSSWKGMSNSEVEQDLAIFQSIYQSSLEKSLQISLVRDVDGKTFWDALDEAISPRIKKPTPVDDTALSTFRSIFQALSLKKGTLILLTWLEPSKMLVSVSLDGVPTQVDATIESMNVTKALFDVFFGESPVSPTLKSSVAGGLSTTL